MTRHRSHSIEFKRQVAQDYVAGETLHNFLLHLIKAVPYKIHSVLTDRQSRGDGAAGQRIDQPLAILLRVVKGSCEIAEAGRYVLLIRLLASAGRWRHVAAMPIRRVRFCQSRR